MGTKYPVKTIVFVVLVIVGFIWGVGYNAPVEKMAIRRGIRDANADFTSRMVELEEQKRSGKINNATFHDLARAERNLLHREQEAAANPGLEVCRTTLVEDGPMISMEIPAVCGYHKPEVYSKRELATFKVEFNTKEGDPAPQFPQFTSEFGSVSCNKQAMLCELKGPVYYFQETGGKYRHLKLLKVK